MAGNMFRIFTQGAIDKAKNQTILAAEIETDASHLSRFISGQEGFKMDEIEKLLEYGDAVIVPRKTIEDFKTMIRTYHSLWEGRL
jgi:hypothetical protein